MNQPEQLHYHNNNNNNPNTIPTQQTRRSMIPHTDNPAPIISETHIDDILALELSDTLINAAYNLSAMKINLAIQKICMLEKMFIREMAWGFESMLECANREYKVGVCDRLREVCVVVVEKIEYKKEKSLENSEEEVKIERIPAPIMLTSEQQQQKLFITIREKLSEMTKIIEKKHNLHKLYALILINSHFEWIKNSLKRKILTNEQKIITSSPQEMIELSQIKSDKSITKNMKTSNNTGEKIYLEQQLELEQQQQQQQLEQQQQQKHEQKEKSKTIIIPTHNNSSNNILSIIMNKHENTINDINNISISRGLRSSNNEHRYKLSMSLNSKYHHKKNNDTIIANNNNSSNNKESSRQILGKNNIKFTPMRVPKTNYNNNTSSSSPTATRINFNLNNSESLISTSTKSNTNKEKELELLRNKYNKLFDEFQSFSNRFMAVIKEE